MSTHTESVSQRIMRFPGRIQSLRHLKQIHPEHLDGMSRIELYAVIVEHWPKCNSDARRQLVGHGDPFVRGQARAMEQALLDCPALGGWMSAAAAN